MARETEKKEEVMTPRQIEAFLNMLREKGRGEGSLDNYRQILTALYDYLPEDKILDTNTAQRWRSSMLEKKGLSHTTVNSRMSVLNSFLRYLGHRSWQMEEFVREAAGEQPLLTRTEYLRLLSAAKRMGRERSYLLVKTMGGAGVRVQELAQVTVESVEHGMVLLDGHNGQRMRMMYIPNVLRQELLEYAHREGIRSGPVFVSKEGSPLSRSCIHRDVSTLSQEAQVDAEKSTPRCLWKMYRNINDTIEENIAVLARQTYEHMMETEQQAIGWEAG